MTRRRRLRNWSDHEALMSNDASVLTGVKSYTETDLCAYDQLPAQVQQAIQDTGFSPIEALRTYQRFPRDQAAPRTVDYIQKTYAAVMKELRG
jgi:hypothetical protein